MPRRAIIDVALAKRMRDIDRKTLDEIAAVFGVTRTTISTHIDPEYAEQRRQAKEAMRKRPKPKHVEGNGSGYRADGAGDLVAAVAPDTRTWQQKFFGDPAPSRSALAGRKI